MYISVNSAKARNQRRKKNSNLKKKGQRETRGKIDESKKYLLLGQKLKKKMFDKKIK